MPLIVASLPGRGKIGHEAVAFCLTEGSLDERRHTTAVVQRDLDEPAQDSPAEPVVRALLDRDIRRLYLRPQTVRQFLRAGQLAYARELNDLARRLDI